MAKTFKFGENGKWATKTGSSLAYNDQNDNFKPMPFSVTRDSIATRVNKEGLIEVVGKDKLRIDYTDSSKGVALLEPARENLLFYSEDFSEWTLANAGTGSTPILTPNYSSHLGLSVSRIIFERTSTVSSTSTIRGNDYFTGTNSFSIYIKSNTSNVTIDFRLGATIIPQLITTDWQRLTFTGSDFYRSLFGLIGSDSSLYADLSIVAAQAEAGSYATSYIPTSGARFERKADVANGAGNSEVFNDSEGVLFANIQGLFDGDDATGYISLSDGSTATNALMIQYRNTGELRLYNGGTSTPQMIYRDAFADLSKNIKLAIKYGTTASNYKVFIDGFSRIIQGNFVATSMSGLDELQFAYPINSANPFRGKSKEIGVYDAVLTDAELEALTSYTSFTNMANELNLTIK